MSRTYDNHVLLGAGDAIAGTLVPEPLRRGSVATLVSRRGTQIGGTRGVSADLLVAQSLADAVPARSAELGTAARHTVLSCGMIGLTGLFDRTVKELGEVLYQDEHDYVFDSSKFERHFSFVPTPYEKGVAETAEYYRAKHS